MEATQRTILLLVEDRTVCLPGTGGCPSVGIGSHSALTKESAAEKHVLAEGKSAAKMWFSGDQLELAASIFMRKRHCSRIWGRQPELLPARD